MSPEITLLPCPHCGGQGKPMERTCNPKDAYNAADRAFPVVRCDTCHAQSCGGDWQSIETAVAAWNTRAPLAPVGVEPYGWVKINAHGQKFFIDNRSRETYLARPDGGPKDILDYSIAVYALAASPVARETCDEKMAYVGRCACGAIEAVCLDLNQFREDTAEAVKDMIAVGLTVERLPVNGGGVRLETCTCSKIASFKRGDFVLWQGERHEITSMDSDMGWACLSGIYEGVQLCELSPATPSQEERKDA